MKDGKLKERLIKASIEETERLFGTTCRTTGKSEKAKKIEEVLPKFGCNAAYVAEVLSIVTGEKLESPSDGDEELKFTLLSAVVPTSNPNGHNYTLGRVFVNPGHINDHRYFMGANCVVGNCMPMIRKYVRPATEEEIRKFFDALSDDIIEKGVGSEKKSAINLLIKTMME